MPKSLLFGGKLMPSAGIPLGPSFVRSIQARIARPRPLRACNADDQGARRQLNFPADRSISASYGHDQFRNRRLALALDVRGSNLNVSGVSLAFLAAVGLAVVVAVSSRGFGNGDARPVTIYMSATATALLLLLCGERRLCIPAARNRVDRVRSRRRILWLRDNHFFHRYFHDLTSTSTTVSAILGVVVLGQALTATQVAGITLVIIALVGATVRRDQAT